MAELLTLSVREPTAELTPRPACPEVRCWPVAFALALEEIVGMVEAAQLPLEAIEAIFEATHRFSFSTGLHFPRFAVWKA